MPESEPRDMILTSTAVPPEQLLAEIEDILRLAPAYGTANYYEPENIAWAGRASATMTQWDTLHGGLFDRHLANLIGPLARESEAGYRSTMMLLNKARSDLRMRTLGPKNIAIGQGQVFDYFDELRKVIEPARQEVFFVDRYLNAEFVSRYMPHVHGGTEVRLLTRGKVIPQLLPAIEAFALQSGLVIAIRTSDSMHDRYLFVDRAQCYQSGASFKDGAKSSPTTLTQISDAFAVVLKTYEDMWDAAGVVR